MKDLERELIDFMYWLGEHDISMFDDIEKAVLNYLSEKHKEL